MHRSVHALAAGSALIAAVALASGCQGSGRAPVPSSATPTPVRTPAATTAAAAPQPSGPVTATQLVAALPPRPAGAKGWAGRGGPSGALSQRQYLTVEFGAASAAKLLPGEQQAGLTSGAQRSWRQPNGTLVLAVVGDYRDRAGAKASYLQIEYELELGDAGDTDFTLPGAADSYGIGDPTLDQAGNTESDLLVLAGNTLLHVEVKAPGTVDQATAKAVAAQVYANLCRISDCTAGSTS
ncbi:hypothetical protein [Streptacidiphilus sp. PAMC 29251]